MNLGAMFFAWGVGAVVLAVVAACLMAGPYAADAARHLTERYRHRRDLRRWHETCAIHDHQLLAEATAIVRQADRRRT